MRTQEEAGLTEVMRARWTPLTRYALALTGEPAAAQALLVDVLAGGGRSGPDEMAGEDLEAEVREALARAQWRRNAPAAAPPEPPPAAGSVDERAGAGQPAGEATGEATAEDADEVRRLREAAALQAAMATLAGRERAALVLRHVDRLDDSQVAEVLGTRRARVRRAAADGADRVARSVSRSLGAPLGPDAAERVIAAALLPADEPDIGYSETLVRGSAERRQRRRRRSAGVAGTVLAVVGVGVLLAPGAGAPDPAADPPPTGAASSSPGSEPLEESVPLQVIGTDVPLPGPLRSLLPGKTATAVKRELPGGFVGRLRPHSGGAASSIVVTAGRYDLRTGRPVGPIAVVDFAELRYRMLEEVRPRHSMALAVDEQFVTWHSRAQISCRERDGDQFATLGADPLGTIVSSAGRRAWQVQRGDLGDRFVAVAEGCGPGRDLPVDGRLQAMDWPWVYVAGADGLARVDGRTANREVLDPSVRTDSPATVAAELGRAAYISKGRVRLHSPADFHDLGPTPFPADALDQAVALGSRLVVVSARDTGRTVSRIYDLHAQTIADIDHLATVVGDYLVVERDNDVLVVEAS